MPFQLSLPRLLIALFPLAYFAGKAAVDVHLSLTALLFLVHSATTKDWQWLKAPWVRLALAWWALLLLRAAFATHPEEALLRALPFLRFPIFTAALAYWVLADKTCRRFFLNIAAIFVIAVTLDIFLQYILRVDIFGHRPYFNGHIYRLTAVTGNPNIGILLAWFSLPAIYHLFLSSNLWWKRTLSIALAGAVVMAIALTGERMALLSMGLGLLIIGAFSLKHIGWKAITGLGLVAVLSVGILFTSDTILQRNLGRITHVITDWPETIYGQLSLNGLAIFTQHPMLGVGAKHYRYHCTEGVAVPAVCDTETGENRFQHPHNIYVEILAEQGILGMMALLGLLVLWARAVWRHVPHTETVLLAVVAAIIIRIWPIGSTPGFYIAWSMASFWCYAGLMLAMNEDKDLWKNTGKKR